MLRWLAELGAGWIPLVIVGFILWHWNTGGAASAPPVITIRIVK